MSVNDYWIAKMRATEAGGEEANPETTMEEEVAVEKDEQYQAGWQGTQRRINRETGEVEEVPADPATTPAPGVVDENPPEENPQVQRAGVKGDPRTEDGRAVSNPEVVEDETPLVDQNYRPVANPETHEGPVFKYAPTTTDVKEVGEDDEGDVTPEENIPAETKTYEEQRSDNEGAQPGPVAEGTTEEEGVYGVSGVPVPDDDDDDEVAQATQGTPGERVVAGDAERRTTTSTTGRLPGQGNPDTYEADKAAATKNVPTRTSTKQEIKDYLIYEHGVDPDDLKNQSKDELLELVRDLA